MNLQEAVQQYFGAEGTWNVERLPSELLVEDLSADLCTRLRDLLKQKKDEYGSTKDHLTRGPLSEEIVALTVAVDCITNALQTLPH